MPNKKAYKNYRDEIQAAYDLASGSYVETTDPAYGNRLWAVIGMLLEALGGEFRIDELVLERDGPAYEISISRDLLTFEKVLRAKRIR